MTAITIAAKAQAIAATALFVNTKEPRSQLAGVAFQRKNDQLRLVGTDGTALFAITLPAVELPYDFSDVTITFTADQLRAFSKKSNRDQDVTLRIDTVANLAEVCFDSTSSIATIIDHKYPDVDRIIDADRTPAPGDDTPPAFQTKYLITFDKVAKLLGGDASMRIHAKGELNAVAVRFPAHPDVQAVIMPVHVKDQ